MVDEVDRTEKGRGTGIYKAPELLERLDDQGKQLTRTFSRKTDIWAIGCILYRVTTTGRHRAFINESDHINFARGLADSKLPQLVEDANPCLARPTTCPVEHCTKPFRDLINSILRLCFAIQESDRTTAMKLKVRFEEMKEHLVAESSFEREGS